VLDERGWLATGDLGVLEASGQLRFIGRLKDVIRVGGENLAPAELEDLLLRHPAVSAVQVVSVPYERLGEVPAAFIVLRRNATMDETELIAWARARIAGFKVPRYVWLVDSFDDVMTGSGKPQKNLLRERALKLKEQSA
jgi:fatty-acyl-CoA synthase